MTLQEQGWAMSCHLGGDHELIDDRTGLAKYLEEELRKAFRAGQRAGQERIGIPPSLVTLACERCTFLSPKLTYHKGTRLLLCDACKDAVDRKPTKEGQ